MLEYEGEVWKAPITPCPGAMTRSRRRILERMRARPLVGPMLAEIGLGSAHPRHVMAPLERLGWVRCRVRGQDDRTLDYWMMTPAGREALTADQARRMAWQDAHESGGGRG